MQTSVPPNPYAGKSLPPARNCTKFGQLTEHASHVTFASKALLNDDATTLCTSHTRELSLSK